MSPILISPLLDVSSTCMSVGVMLGASGRVRFLCRVSCGCVAGGGCCSSGDGVGVAAGGASGDGGGVRG